AGVADASQGLGGDASAAGVGLAHRHLHPEPRLVFCGLAPDTSHGGPGVPLDHAPTLMQNPTEGKGTPVSSTTGRGFRARASPAQSFGLWSKGRPRRGPSRPSPK